MVYENNNLSLEQILLSFMTEQDPMLSMLNGCVNSSLMQKWLRG